MADEWDKYLVDTPANDEWEQYVVSDKKTNPSQSMEKQNFIGQTFNVPSAAIRSELLGTGYNYGALNPSKIPTIQKSMLDDYYGKMPDFPGKTILGNVVSAGGIAGDFVTNPADMLTTLVGGKAVKAIANTPVGQAVGRFLTKQRRFLKFGKDAVLKTAEKGVAGLDKLDDLATQKYGDELKSIKGTTKGVQPIVDKIDEAVNSYPEESYTTIKKIKERIASSEGLTAEELRNLKMEARKGIPRSVFQGKSDPTPQQYAQLQVYNQIDDELVSLGGDKYKRMKAEYSDWKNTAQDAYRALLEDGRPGDVKLRNWFGYGLSRRQTKALEKANFMLPPKEQFMQDFYAWRRGQMAKGLAGASIPITYLIHRAVAEKTIGE